MKKLDSFKGVTLKVEELREVEGGRSIPTLPRGILLY